MSLTVKWVLEVKDNEGAIYSNKFVNKNDAITTWLGMREAAEYGVLKQYRSNNLVHTYDLIK